MKPNITLFICLMIITGLSVLTVIHRAPVFQHLYTYGSRFFDVDTNMSLHRDLLTKNMATQARPVIKISPKTTRKATTATATTNSNIASEDTNTVAYTDISLINSPSWYLNRIRLENVFINCEIKTCRVRNGWDYFNTSDAVVFYAVDLPLKTPPKRINRHQIWVVSGWESPHHTRCHVFSNPEWRNQINWTMTYRLDSDIPVPYGIVKKTENKFNKNYSAIMKSKKKMVAWVVSNCRTPAKRWKYVEQLKEIVPVDVFGKCVSATPTDIFEMINKTYKFYLAFENSLCKDYITEKFFRRQNLDVVLITRGIGNYTK
ncbi:glycoprotein 3-alpha-L-fucosyltransferase A-like, partial [Patella vulgata]|uniref:glycoprotein 3-alpha-L-fucosyltransferase A-like n=1 Tax=Patella vulgata TaxID=6465 RepID=UPI0024A9D5E1